LLSSSSSKVQKCLPEASKMAILASVVLGQYGLSVAAEFESAQQRLV
jgi:hypothetical protein